MKVFLIAVNVVLAVVLTLVGLYSYLRWKATPDYDKVVAAIVVEPGTKMRDSKKLDDDAMVIALEFLLAQKKMEELSPPPERILDHYRFSRVMASCRLAFARWNPYSESAINCLNDYNNLVYDLSNRLSGG